MQEASEQLRSFMRQKGLSQKAIAKAASVSQPTVSRVLKNLPVRHGGARRRLLNYANINESEDQIPRGGKHVLDAFRRVWDGTDKHEKAIAKIIYALEGLSSAPDRKGGLSER